MNHTIALIDLRVRRRPVIGYALGLGVYAFAIVALYPSFKNDTGLDSSPSPVPLWWPPSALTDR